MASAQVEVESERSTDVQLKHLGFVRIVAINAVVVLSNIYGYVKRNSGPLKSTVGTVENAVTAVVTPVYDRFQGVPGDLLVFIDEKVDKAIHTFDECAPSAVMNAVSKSQLIVKRASQIAQDLVKEAQVSGPLAAISHAATISKHFAVGQLAVLWYKVNKYPALHGVSETAVATAAHWSEKYNKLVIDLAAKGNNVFNYVPLVPVDEMARAYKQVEAAANKKVDASSSSGSDSDKE
ncbi:REF/SRPP-like protein At1g67360 isoform X1 [Primulina tabacum]|uniref:REF/SRPP-like protein At1g67360 isoform X1 n=1 Tax=Primulina tabacum TaxID=48773 RepID=UPI003F5ABE9C